MLAKLQVCLERLKLLGCAFSSFHILRSCLSSCNVIFLLRTLPYALAVALAKILSALNDILDVSLNETQWALARLPVRRGGLGMLDPISAAAPAHVAAFLFSSCAAASSGLPSCKVQPAFFTALATLGPSSPAHVTCHMSRSEPFGGSAIRLPRTWRSENFLTRGATSISGRTRSTSLAVISWSPVCHQGCAGCASWRPELTLARGC